MNITEKAITTDGTAKTYAFPIPSPISGDGSGYFFAASVPNGTALMKQGPATPLPQPPCSYFLKVCPYRGEFDAPPAGGFQADGNFVPANLPKDDSELAWTGLFCDNQKFTGPPNAGGQWFTAVNADPAAPSATILVAG